MADTRRGLVRRVQAGTAVLAYRTWGPAGAAPLVLLHALGEQSCDWAQVARALASSWRVYAPDLRGHGASDWAGPYTIEQLAADLAAFVDALGLGQVALGGHSIGGPPAYLYAARHPGRVTRLVLEDPAPPWPRAPRVLARPEGKLPFDWDATALSNQFTDPQASSWRDELRRIAAPALVIAGGPSSHVDQGQLAAMAALIPGCELVTIPAGHLVHAVRPAEFAAAVTGFLGPRTRSRHDYAASYIAASPIPRAVPAPTYGNEAHDCNLGRLPPTAGRVRRAVALPPCRGLVVGGQGYPNLHESPRGDHPGVCRAPGCAARHDG